MTSIAPREPTTVTVDGVGITASVTRPVDPEGRTLIAALHGGFYTGRYFDVAGSVGPTFTDLAVDCGYQVASIDRPGYGDSDAIAPAENTYERQAELLTDAIAQLAGRLGAPDVFLVGHSIGGMIAMTIAAGDPSFRLVGVSVTGMGAVIPPGGASEGLAAAAANAGIDVLPADPAQCDPVMFGPDWTVDPEAVEPAHTTYGPAPAVELIAASKWAREKLPGVAPRVTVPVHNELAEFDALWDSSPSAVATFAPLLTAAPFVDSRIARGTGHSIDHHRLGRALHLRQLAFAAECALLAQRPQDAPV